LSWNDETGGILGLVNFFLRIDENRVQESLKESNKVHKLSYDDLRVRFDDLINDASNDSINQLLIRVLSTSSSSLHPIDLDDQSDVRSTRSCRSYSRKREDEKEDDFKRSLSEIDAEKLISFCNLYKIQSNKSLEIIETPAFYDILDGIEKYRDVLDLPPYWSVKKFLENEPTPEEIESLVNKQYRAGYMKLRSLIDEFLEKFIKAAEQFAENMVTNNAILWEINEIVGNLRPELSTHIRLIMLRAGFYHFIYTV